MSAGAEKKPDLEIPFPVRHVDSFDEVPIEVVRPLAQSASNDYRKTPEAQAKGAKRRAKREQKNRAERIKPLAHNLERSRVCGVTAVRGALTSDLLTALDERFGAERVLKIPAEGNIQGTDNGFTNYIEVAKKISRHWKEHNEKGLLLFDGTNFDGNVGHGTRLLAERVENIAHRQQEVTGKYTDMMILFLGHESLQDVPNPHQGEEGSLAILQHIAVNYRLLKNGELMSAAQPTEFAEYIPPPTRLSLFELKSIREDYEEPPQA